MRFIMGIGLHNYGGSEVQWYAVCKLENQESQWENSVWIWRPQNQGQRGDVHINLWVWRPEGTLMFKERRNRCSVSRKQRENSSFLLVLNDAHPHHSWLILFTIYWLKCSSLPETPCRHIPKIMFTSYSDIPLPKQVDTEKLPSL